MDAGREIVALWRAVGTLQRQAAKLPSRVPVGGGGEIQKQQDIFVALSTSDGEALTGNANAEPPRIGVVAQALGSSAMIYGVECYDTSDPNAETIARIWRRLLTISYCPSEDEPALPVNTFEIQIDEDDDTIYMRWKEAGDPTLITETRKQIWPPLWQTYSEAPE